MLNRFSLLSTLLLLASSFSYALEDQPISFGKVEVGENRLNMDVKDFKISLNLTEKIKAKVALRKNSIQWIRIEEVLLTPRARMAIYLEGNAQNFHIRYRGSSILLQQEGKYAHTEFYVSLFQTDKVEIYQNEKFIGDITIHAKNRPKDQTHLIDYSCSRNDIKIKGMEGEFMSLGCRVQRIGKFGEEKPMMEVLWSSANYRLQDNSKAPYIAVFLSNNPVKLKVINQQNEVREIELSAKIPKRLHRLNTAYGFGPYAFETTYQSDPADKETLLKYTEPAVPAFMLYFNFKLNEDTSIRGFDAAVWKESVFNNAGVYFANDIAHVLDRKLTITTLLGMQYLYFKFDDKYPTISEPIFPQGVEFLYKHAFGITNYIISGGLFLSPSETVDYQNLWVRWGKNYFWELNYIYWGTDQFSAKMWGLSIGLPFKSFF